MDYGTLIELSFYHKFFDFPKDFCNKFSEKKRKFSNKLPLYQKFSKFRVSRRFEYHLNSQRKEAMCTTVGFDALFDSDRTFLIDLLAENIRKEISLRFVDSSKDFYTVLHKQEKDTGLHDAH